MRLLKRSMLGAVVVGVVSLVLAAPAHAVRPGAVKDYAETLVVNIPTEAATNARTVVKSVRGGYVTAISFICDTAPCEIALYDSASATPGDGTVKWEGRVAVNNDTYAPPLLVPLVFTNGIAFEVTGTGEVSIAFQ